MATIAKESTLCKYSFALATVHVKLVLCIAFSIKTILSFIYSALLQMMQMILRERTFDCICKTRHAEKFASVLDDIRAVNYMLYWVVSIIYIY